MHFIHLMSVLVKYFVESQHFSENTCFELWRAKHLNSLLQYCLSSAISTCLSCVVEEPDKCGIEWTSSDEPFFWELFECDWVVVVAHPYFCWKQFWYFLCSFSIFMDFKKRGRHNAYMEFTILDSHKDMYTGCS